MTVTVTVTVTVGFYGTSHSDCYELRELLEENLEFRTVTVESTIKTNSHCNGHCDGHCTVTVEVP